MNALYLSDTGESFADEGARRVVAGRRTAQSRRDARRIAIDGLDLEALGVARYAPLYDKMAGR